MSEHNTTIKTTAVLDVNQAQAEIIKLNGIASDTTKDLETRIAAKNKQIKLQNKLNEVTIRQAKALEKGLTGVKGEEKALTAATKNRERAVIKAARADALNTKHLNKLNASLVRAKKSSSGFSSGMKSMAIAFTGSMGAIALFTKLKDVINNVIGTAKDFEFENAKLAGVLNVSTKETSLLTMQAKTLGGIYPTLAKDVLKLQVAYARLGFTQREIFDLTKDTIEGSYALNTTLDHTSLLVGAVVKAFDSLEATDAKRIIDDLTKSTQKSSLNFEALSISLPKVAGAASATGTSLEDLLAYLGQAMNATQDASIAGTSLRKILARNAKAGRTMAESMKIVRDATNQVATAQKLYGDRAFVVALALANQQEKTKELADEIKNSNGIASSTAKKMMNTYAGSVSRMQSAWERLTLTLNDANSGLTAFYNTLADVLTFLAGKDTPNPFKNVEEGYNTALALYKGAVNEMSHMSKYATDKERDHAREQVNFYAKALTRWQLLMNKKHKQEVDAEKKKNEKLKKLKAAKDKETLQAMKTYIEMLKVKIKHEKLYGIDSFKTEKELLKKQKEYELYEKERSSKEKLVIDKKYNFLYDKLIKERQIRDKKAELDLESQELQDKARHGQDVYKQQILLLEKQKKLELSVKFLTDQEKAAIDEKYQKREEDLTKAHNERVLNDNIQTLDLYIQQKKKNGEETLSLEIANLEQKKQAELSNTELTEQEKENIKEHYRQLEDQAILDHKLKSMDDQLALDELDIQNKQLNYQYTLDDQLKFLDEQKKRELANKNLTEKERLAIEKKYNNASKKMTQEAEKAKMQYGVQTVNSAISGLGELFGIQKEAAVAQMMIAAPQAIGNSFKEAAKIYAPPMSEVMGAIGAAAVVLPIISGIRDIIKVRFSKSKKSVSGGSLSVPKVPTTENISNLAPNNAVRLGEDSSIGSAAGSDAANNLVGTSSVGVVFSEGKYSDFLNQVKFKEEKTSI